MEIKLPIGIFSTFVISVVVILTLLSLLLYLYSKYSQLKTRVVATKNVLSVDAAAWEEL